MPFVHTTVGKALLAMCKEVSSPVSERVERYARDEDFTNLVSMRVRPQDYDNAELYWRDSLVVDFLRKCPDLPTDHDREEVAHRNFTKSEHACYRTNERLARFLPENSAFALSQGDTRIQAFITEARRIVLGVLGPRPPDDVSGRFGPGATFGDKGRLTTIPDKMSSRPTLTSSAWPWLVPWSATAWASACVQKNRSPEFVRGNRFTTVPKDAEKDRGICIEPSVNLFYQLGLGRVIKKLLAAAGLDLWYAQDVHRALARVSSGDGTLATLDLSNASDTVAWTLVRLLLPHAWFAVLNDLRSPMTLFKGRWIKLEKFSSMGNGFTFELETLIFASLALAAVRLRDPQASLSDKSIVGGEPGHKRVWVFGDDIIIPRDSAGDVMSTLRYFGFDLNEAKTFVDGPFRESCGGDFFAGVAVRPYQLKELPSEPQHYIALANGLRRSSQGASPSRWPYVRRAWHIVTDELPSHIKRLRGPEAFGDICLHDDEHTWQKRQRGGWNYLGVYRPISGKDSWVSWDHFGDQVVLATAVYGSGDGLRGVLPRDSVTSYKVGWVPLSALPAPGRDKRIWDSHWDDEGRPLEPFELQKRWSAVIGAV